MSRDEFNRQGVPFALCFDEGRCTACMSCAIICPDMAIRIFRLAPPAPNSRDTAMQNPRDTAMQNPRDTATQNPRDTAMQNPRDTAAQE
jgi:Fe-S-cluster-containing hydrogenase component 2